MGLTDIPKQQAWRGLEMGVGIHGITAGEGFEQRRLGLGRAKTRLVEWLILGAVALLP